MPEGRCPGVDELHRFVMGDLNESAMATLADHLERCDACQHDVENRFQRGTIAIALRAVPDTPGPFESAARDDETASRRIGADDGRRVLDDDANLEQLGHFRILKLLGQGGMGQVYLAEDSRLKRRVALKVLRGKYSSNDDSHRFQAEAEAAAKLTHPGIVPIHEVGEDAGRRYLTMTFIEGQTLGQRLSAGPLPSREAALLVRTVAMAVAYAHSQGVIHRDLKPSNILLDHLGQPLVADFGLAKRNDSDSELTQSGQVIGTPSYMPPEQAKGNNAEVGPRSDVYALGATLYCVLTGRPPFQAANVVETLQLVVSREPVAPRHLNPTVARDLETICLKCLEKRPEKRYASAAALAEDLGRYLDRRPILARPIGRFEKLARWAGRNPLLSSSLAATVLVFLLAFVFVTRSYFRTENALADKAEEHAAAVRLTGELREQEKAERLSRYLADISAASSALQLYNVGAARRFLEDAPDELRGWEWRHFVNQLDDAQLVLRGHEGQAYVVVFSPASHRLATVGADDTVRLWDLASGKQELSLRGKSKVLSLAFSEDGTRVASGSPHGATVWDARTGQELRTVDSGEPDSAVVPVSSVMMSNVRPGTILKKIRFIDAGTGLDLISTSHRESVIAFCRSGDGHWIATTNEDAVVRLWDVRTGKLGRSIKGHTVFVDSVAFSPDSRRVVSGGGYPDNFLRLGNVADAKEAPPLRGHTNAIQTIAYSPDGARFASGSMDQTVRLWQGKSGEPQGELRGHTNWVNQVLFSPNGKYLVSASEDRTLRVWDGATGGFLTVLKGHTGSVTRATFSRDGALLASASYDGTVRVWDVERLANRGVLRGHTSFVYSVAVSPDGKLTASTGWDGTIRIWDSATYREVGTWKSPSPVLVSLRFAPDGETIVATSNRGIVYWWNWRTKTLLRKFDLSKDGPEPVAVAVERELETTLAVDFSGNRAAAGSPNGCVHIWNATTGKLAATLSEGEPSWIREVSFDPSGKRLAAGSNVMGKDQYLVRIWDVDHRETIKTLSGHTQMIYTVEFSADGRWLASGSIDGTARLWDAATLELVAVLRHGGNVYKLAFSPDGRRLATACADNTVRLWDLATRREVAELRGHDSYVHGLAWSPDGTQLFTGSGDHTVRIWDSLSVPERTAKQEQR